MKPVNRICLNPRNPLHNYEHGLKIFWYSIGNSFLGARFSILESTLITEIGGQAQSWADDNHPTDWDFDRTVFLSLVPLRGDSFFPSDINLSDAIFSQVVELSWSSGNYAIRNDVLISVNQILDPGDYGIVFGSGLFGATGTGRMPYTSAFIEKNLSDPIYFTYQPHAQDYWLGLNINSVEYHPRFIVNGESAPVPEPATVILLGTGLLGLASASRRKFKRFHNAQ